MAQSLWQAPKYPARRHTTLNDEYSRLQPTTDFPPITFFFRRVSKTVDRALSIILPVRVIPGMQYTAVVRCSVKIGRHSARSHPKREKRDQTNLQNVPPRVNKGLCMRAQFVAM